MKLFNILASIFYGKCAFSAEIEKTQYCRLTAKRQKIKCEMD